MRSDHRPGRVAIRAHACACDLAVKEERAAKQPFLISSKGEVAVPIAISSRGMPYISSLPDFMEPHPRVIRAKDSPNG